MKQLFFLLLALAGTGIFAVSPADLPIGAPLPKPTVKMKDISGKEASLQDAIKENGLLVMFTCNTCPYVIKNQKRTHDVCTYALSKNIGVILINANEGARNGDDCFEAMQQYASKQDYKWLYTVDAKNELADAFGARRTPECFLFNKEGVLVYKGAIDDNPADEAGVKRAHLQEAMGQMLEGKEVSVKTSRSVGCSIKRL